MNNSKLVIDSASLRPDPVPDLGPTLREREGELLQIIASIQKVQSSKEWSSLKTYVFDGLTERLSKDILSEAKKENPDALKLNRLAGQLKWAEQYSDLLKLEEKFRIELAQVRLKLHGTTEKTG